MTDVTTERKLVKSRPELWAELSEVESLARHLGELGEVRITKVEPESTVAWEGELISGTVELEQSGWGTKVTLSATVPEPDQIAPPVEPDPSPGPIKPPGEPEPEPAPGPILPPDEEPEPTEVPTPGRHDPEPAAQAAPPEARRGFWARILRRQPAAAGPDAERDAEVVTADADVATVAPEAMTPEADIATVEPEAMAPEADVAPVEPEAEAVEADIATVEPEGEVEPSESDGLAAERVREILDGTLEALGQAHHRPFSRG